MARSTSTQKHPDMLALLQRVVRSDFQANALAPITETQRHCYENKRQRVASIFMTAEAMLFSMEFYTLSKVLENKAPSVVDIGSGMGEIRDSLRRHHYKGPYLGLDVRDLAAEYQGKLDAFICCNALKAWPLKTGSVPFMICSEVLEHVPRDQSYRLMDRMYTSLAPGGKLVVTTPAWKPGRDMEEEIRKFGHCFYWKREEFFSNAKDLGFRVLERFNGRHLGAGSKYGVVERDIAQAYGKGGVELARRIKARFGGVVASSLLYHVAPSCAPSHIQCVLERPA